MPSALTYPGVYIEEIPSGVRTITGVSTSITAFMGRAQRGPVATPTLISSFRDYERLFGGLWLSSPMSYAVRDFFANGGSTAVIVRLYNAAQGDGVLVAGKARITLDSLELEALNPGVWGNNLSAYVDYANRDSSLTIDAAAGMGLANTDLFNLTVIYTSSVGPTIERYTNVTFKDVTRRVDRVLAQSSNFVRVVPSSTDATQPTLPASLAPPAATAANEDGSLGIKPTAGSAVDSSPLTDSSYDLTTLDSVDIFNLLCIPPDTLTGDTSTAVYSAAMTYCAGRRAILIVDPPNSLWKGKEPSALNVTDLGLNGTAARNAAVYYPRIVQPNPLRGSQLEEFVPCGVIAGIIARTDTERGVWKAPAGVDASLTGVQSLQVKLTDAASGFLNPQGINCLRSLPVTGHVIWGARTLRGSDLLADDYKYLPVRRLALFIEESIFRGTQWAVFEPNDEPLWSQIRLNVGSFMQGLFRQSAFQGQSPREAYFVKCDKETTTQADINSGIVNITVGFAPLKPAEFVVIRFQQMAGQSAT